MSVAAAPFPYTFSMSRNSEVIIVGAGVIGCAIAYALARERVRVTVLERSGIAAESSGAAAGILSPRMNVTEPELYSLALVSEQQFAPLVQLLQEETGLDPEYLRSGGLEVAYDEAGEQALRNKAQTVSSTGQRVEWLDADAVRTLEPRLDPTLRGGVQDPGAMQIHPTRFTHALAQAAARRGVRFEFGADAQAIERIGSRASSVKATTGDFSADHVVMAAGAWAGHWAPTLGVQIPVFPVRGQIMSLIATPTPVRAIVYGHGVYLLPRADGTTVLGATYERVGFDKSLTAGAIGRLLTNGTALVPSLENARFDRAWTGLRPGSGDELPIIGPVPGWENVSLATGHYREGVMLAPLTASIITDLILGRESDFPSSHLQPSRFGAL